MLFLPFFSALTLSVFNCKPNLKRAEPKVIQLQPKSVSKPPATGDHLHKTNNNFSHASCECANCEFRTASALNSNVNVACSDKCKTIRHTRAAAEAAAATAQSLTAHADRLGWAKEGKRTTLDDGRAKSVTSNMHQ